MTNLDLMWVSYVFGGFKKKSCSVAINGKDIIVHI